MGNCNVLPEKAPQSTDKHYEADNALQSGLTLKCDPVAAIKPLDEGSLRSLFGFSGIPLLTRALVSEGL